MKKIWLTGREGFKAERLWFALKAMAVAWSLMASVGVAVAQTSLGHWDTLRNQWRKEAQSHTYNDLPKLEALAARCDAKANYQLALMVTKFASQLDKQQLQQYHQWHTGVPLVVLLELLLVQLAGEFGHHQGKLVIGFGIASRGEGLQLWQVVVSV